MDDHRRFDRRTKAPLSLGIALGLLALGCAIAVAMSRQEVRAPAVVNEFRVVLALAAPPRVPRRGAGAPQPHVNDCSVAPGSASGDGDRAPAVGTEQAAGTSPVNRAEPDSYAPPSAAVPGTAAALETAEVVAAGALESGAGRGSQAGVPATSAQETGAEPVQPKAPVQPSSADVATSKAPSTPAAADIDLSLAEVELRTQRATDEYAPPPAIPSPGPGRGQSQGPSIRPAHGNLRSPP